MTGPDMNSTEQNLPDLTGTRAGTAKKNRIPSQTMDGRGKPVADPTLTGVFGTGRTHFDSCLYFIRIMRAEIMSLASQPHGTFVVPAQLEALMDNLAGALKEGKPYAICPFCKGAKCRACRDTGWVNRIIYDTAPKELTTPPQPIVG